MGGSLAKFEILSLIGVFGGAIATALGGWDTGLQTLVICMAADYLTGMAVAFVWRKSPKTENGGASSQAGLKGLMKKGAMLLLVLVAVRLDLIMGLTYIRDAVIIALVVNEIVSLTENLGLMGVPIPGPIEKGIELLKSKGDQQNGN